MNVNLHIKSDFSAVYLVNGVFIEKADRLVIRKDEVTYVTVLPLSAALLPYTVMVAGGRVRNNEELCRIFALTDKELVMRLAARYNYVYSSEPRSAHGDKPLTLAQRFFSAAISGDVSSARRFMTPGLSAATDDASLAAFFDGYDEIIVNDGYIPAAPHSYFLIDRNGKSTLFTFVMKDNLIDDIIERG